MPSQYQPPVVPGRHGRFIEQQLPSWLAHASPAHLQRLRRYWPAPAEGIVDASQRHLRHLQRQRHQAVIALGRQLKALQGPVDFCAPLLGERLRTELGHEVDVLRVELAPVSCTPWPQGRLQVRSVLSAALQNFAHDTDYSACQVFTSADTLAMGPNSFARLCHQLDLGGRYQRHLDQVLSTEQAALRSRHIQASKALLREQLQMAAMQGHVSDAGQQMILDLLGEAPQLRYAGKPARVTYLKLYNAEVFELLLIGPERDFAGQAEPLLVYMPGAPARALREYPSARAAYDELVLNLKQPAWLETLRGYLRQREQPRVLDALEQRLWPLRPDSDGLYVKTFDAGASLNIEEQPVPTEVFGWLFDRFLFRLRDDALQLAVPSAQVDALAREARLAYWESTGLSVLNIAALFVPMLGEVMAAVAACDLIDSCFEAAQTWEEGELHQAGEQLLAIGANLAINAGFAAAGHVQVSMAPRTLVEGLVPVHLPQGGLRLWKPAWEPYAVEAERGGNAPDARGIHAHGGEQWIRVAGRNYPVFQDDGGDWRLRAADPQAYQPLLRHNGEGAWQLQGEQPAGWHREDLLRRLGPLTEGLDDGQLDAVARICDIDEAYLRAVQCNHEPMPALLKDALQHLQALRGEGMDSLEAVEQWLTRPGPSQAADVQRLLRMFTGLTPAAAQEILAHASDALREDLAQGLGGPSLAVAEEARLYQRRLRLQRGLLGLYEPRLAGQATACLAVGLLPALRGWSGEVCLELREGRLAGRLLARAGDPAVLRKSLVLRTGSFTAFDEQGLELSPAATLFEALMHALPDSERDALQVTFHETHRLRLMLYRVAMADRARASRALGQQPLHPWFRSPLRLADGRRGYPLGGINSLLTARNRRLRELFPHLDDEQVRALRVRLVADGADIDVAISALEEEFEQLEISLRQWQEAAGQSFERPRRGLIARRLVDAWRGLGLDESGLLNLSSLQVSNLPVLNAHFEHVRGLNLAYMELPSLPEALLRGFRSLQLLRLEYNQLSRLPDALLQMRDLRVLNLSHNDLGEASGLLAPLQGLPRLRRLLLNGNRLHSLSPQVLAVLAGLPALRHLDLGFNLLRLATPQLQQLARIPLERLNLARNRITLEPADTLLFSQMPHLRELSLSHNPLQRAPQLGNLGRLEQLNLRNCGLTQWPDGLLALMEQNPQRLRGVELSHNQIVELPALEASSFARHVQRGARGRYWLHLNGNPLDPAATAQLERLRVDFIAASASLGEAQGWLQEADPAQRDLWNRLFQGNANLPLRDMLERLRLSRDFQLHPQDVRRRLWDLLEMAADHSSLRERLVELAGHYPATCGDAGADAFSEMETALLVFRQSQQALSQPGRSRQLLHLFERLYRRAETERLADSIALQRSLRRSALSRGEPAPTLDRLDDLNDADLEHYADDPIEVRLLIRQALAGPLDYPEPSTQMLYQDLAQVSPDVLRNVCDAVRGSDSEANRLAWMVENPNWQAYLRERYPEHFQQVTAVWAEGTEYLDDCLAGTWPPSVRPAHAVLQVVHVALGEPLTETAGLPPRLALDSGRYLVAMEALRVAHEQAVAALSLSLTRSEALTAT